MTTSNLAGKVAVVTGAASGIGQAVVQLLRDEGATVVGADVADGADAKLDITSEADWDRVVNPLPQLDLLVHSAGISQASPLASTTLDDWRRVLAVNLDAAFLAVRAALRKMQSGSSIVLIGSASGTKAVSGAAAYCCSKAGVRMLAKAAALEAKPLGIRVNCLSPAGVATPLWTKMDFFKDFPNEEAAWAALGGIDPAKPALDRMAFAPEIAQAVLFLCSPAAGGITGIDLPVDAGYTI
jgi:NAD(P)-dependent dehydrogenase (short-subunit alcohol dehydrogenase family)